MTRISIIAIVGRDGAIGIGGDQPWHISEDFRHFKAVTLGKPVIMGRKTFEALPRGPLPGRRNIVITRNPEWRHEGVDTASSLEAAIALCADVDEAFVIGGGAIYAAALPLASRLELTLVDADTPAADTFFPPIDLTQWRIAEQSEKHTDPKTNTPFRFTTWQKICATE